MLGNVHACMLVAAQIFDLLLPLPSILVQLYFLLEKWASQSASIGGYRTSDSHMMFAAATAS